MASLPSESCPFAPIRSVAPRRRGWGREQAPRLFAVPPAEERAELHQRGGGPILSRRQRECLDWTAKGKSSADIAVILGLSVSTIDGHIKAACERFGVRTRIQAVLEAYKSGQIE